MKPGYLSATITYDPETGEHSVEFPKPHPCVIDVADEYKASFLPDLTRLGYRRLWSEPFRLTVYYARPWPVWAFYKTRHSINERWWAVLRQLRIWKLIHTSVRPGSYTRFRDLRPGP